MDIEKLIEKANHLGMELKRDGGEFEYSIGKKFLEYAAALSTLQAENEKLRAELEQVIAERGALIEDFVDYVTDGVPNPAIFCKNRCNKCVDMRGWCTGKNCKGFYPSVASGQKEG